MEILEKIARALRKSFSVDYLRLDDDDGVNGFVVSPSFQGLPALNRQDLIDQALRKPSARITEEEQRRISMIAGLTPDEYDSVGVRIGVHQVRERGGGIEVRLRGGYSDAEYVRGALKNHKGVQATEPKPVPGAIGILMSFVAKGDATTPLTKERAIRILQGDRHIEVMPNS